MQFSDLQNHYNFRSILMIFAILQLTLVAVTNSPILILLFLGISYILFFLSFYFWFLFIKSRIKSKPDFSTSFCLFFSFLFYKRPLLIVSDFLELQDYFLLNEKAYFRNIYIECGKAAAMESPNGSIRILFDGFHKLYGSEFIRSIFSIGKQSFVIGTNNDRYSYKDDAINENKLGLKTHQYDFQRIRSFTKDNYEIYPSLIITYQLGNIRTRDSSTNEIFHAFSQLMQKNQQSGKAQPFIQEFIKEKVILLWREYVNESTLQEILAPYPECGLKKVLSRIQDSISELPNLIQDQQNSEGFSNREKSSLRQKESFDTSLMEIKISIEDLKISDWSRIEKGMRSKQGNLNDKN